MLQLLAPLGHVVRLMSPVPHHHLVTTTISPPQEWQRVQTMVAQLDSDSGTPEALPWAADSVPGLTTDQQAVGGGDTDTRWSGLTLVKVEDASLLESPATQLIAQQMSLVDMAYEHAKGQLTALQEMQAGSSSSVDDDARSINVDDQA